MRRLLVVTAVALACGGDSSGPSFTSSAPCDAGLALASVDPVDAARAIGICDGLVSAEWVYPDGVVDTLNSTQFHIGHGILPAFGTMMVPLEGDALLALSSGTARASAHAGFSPEYEKGYASGLPAGYPTDREFCPDPQAQGNDGIGLRVVMVVPAGVSKLRLQYAYFTRDFPQWVCTDALDETTILIAGLSGIPGVTNLAVDPSGNPMLASNTSMLVCNDTSLTDGQYTCPFGTASLAGTGYDGHGGSGWLATSTLAVTPGDTVRITFAIWDTADQIVDSTLLVDGFAWIP